MDEAGGSSILSMTLRISPEQSFPRPCFAQEPVVNINALLSSNLKGSGQ